MTATKTATKIERSESLQGIIEVYNGLLLESDAAAKNYLKEAAESMAREPSVVLSGEVLDDGSIVQILKSYTQLVGEKGLSGTTTYVVRSNNSAPEVLSTNAKYIRDSKARNMDVGQSVDLGLLSKQHADGCYRMEDPVNVIKLPEDYGALQIGAYVTFFNIRELLASRIREQGGTQLTIEETQMICVERGEPLYRLELEIGTADISRVGSRLRTTDIAKKEGTKAVIYLPGTTQEGAQIVYERLSRMLGQHYTPETAYSAAKQMNTN